MVIDDDLRQRIGVALNEAALLGIEFDRASNRVGCTFAVIAMDREGNVPADNRLLFMFQPVGRLVASLRNGEINDPQATAEPLSPEDILSAVQGFNGLSIYGWDFVNVGDTDFDTWNDRLSFDYTAGDSVGLANTIDLFQEGYLRHLDVRIWFDGFEIFTPSLEKVPLEGFLENGKRGWDAIYSGEEKTKGFGIVAAAYDPVMEVSQGGASGAKIPRKETNFLVKAEKIILGSIFVRKP